MTERKNLFFYFIFSLINKDKESNSDQSTSSSNEIVTGSPKKNRKAVRPKSSATSKDILSGSIRSASFNIIFQVFIRIFTFCLNAFILRYISSEFLGICNVRLALLYSTVLFLSRESFRRAALRKAESDKWTDIINLIWISVPNTIVWSFFFGFIWHSLLSQPGNQDKLNLEDKILLQNQYKTSVLIMVLACIVDSLNEVPYIIGQYFLYYKLRIIGDTTLIGTRAIILCFVVVISPNNAIYAYAIGTLLGVIITLFIYLLFFYFELKKPSSNLPFKNITDFLPKFNKGLKLPWETAYLTWSFFKQGILKQLLTEGERYLMTFFDVISFEEQGIYDLVSNLGSLAARFIFLPIEESSYFFFAQTLDRKASFRRKDSKIAQNSAEVLGNLVRLMTFIGLMALVYGIPFSNTALYFYGGKKLSENLIGTKLLQANCAYIFLLALNGVTEAFTFAAMTQDQMERFNKKLVMFSAVFLIASAIFTSYLGSVGFFLANALNMSLRLGQSTSIIKNVFLECNFDPFSYWRQKNKILAIFGIACLIINLINIFELLGRFSLLALGILIFGINIISIYLLEFELLSFFVKMYKNKQA